MKRRLEMQKVTGCRHPEVTFIRRQPFFSKKVIEENG
jgi:hypothetical protein